MKMLRRDTLILLAAILFSSAPALALFDVKDPLTKRYNTESRAVIAGTIIAINPDNHVLTVKPTTVYKGPALADGDMLQIQVAAPDSLPKEVQLNQPVVVFKGAKSAAVHVADHWYLADALEKPNQFRTTARLSPAYDETFPGNTAELIKALDEIKAGKSTLLDSFPTLTFPAPQKVATLPAHAIAFAAAHIDDPKSTTFFVATKEGLTAFALGANNSVKDVTADLGLQNLKPTLLASAPVPFALNLVVDQAFYCSQDGKRQLAKMDRPVALPDDKFFTAAFDPAGFELFVLTPQAIKRFPVGKTLLANARPAASSMNASNSPAPIVKAPPSTDDDTRLTGTKLTDYLKLPDAGFTAASMAFVDVNHDGRPDLIIATPQGTLTLLNRGFGCYLVNKEFAAPLLDPAKTSTPTMPLLASAPTRDDAKILSMPTTLWALEDDGTLYRYDFPTK